MTVYEKQTWIDREIITADHLNKIESGIEAAHNEIIDIQTELDTNAYVNRTYTASSGTIAAEGAYTFLDIDVSVGSLVTVLLTNTGASANLTIYIGGKIGTQPYTSDPIAMSEIVLAGEVIEIFVPTPQDKIKIVIQNNDTGHTASVDLVVRTLGNYSFMDMSIYDPDSDGKVEIADLANLASKLDDGSNGKSYANVMSDVTSAITTHTNNASAHHTNQYDPSATEKLALQGTSGTPGSDNKYVTNSDSRLTDTRNPKSHLHSVSDISNISLAYEPIISTKQTGFNKPYGTTSDTICQGNDSRLTNSRTPIFHAATHKSGNTDPIKLDELAAPTDVTTLNASTSAHGLLSKLPGSTTVFLCGDGSWAIPSSSGAVTFGTTAGTVCEGNDSRLSNSRSPTSHAANHKSAGSDPIKLDELGAPTDVTTLNASTSTHGLLQKLDGNTGHFLNGNGAWTVPQSVITFGTAAGTACEGNDSRLSDSRSPTSHASTHKSTGGDAIRIDELYTPTDITTLNTTTSAHGLCPKLSGNTAQFLNGNGQWTNPSALTTTFVRWNEGTLSTSTSFMPYLVTSNKTLSKIKGYIMTLPVGCNVLIDFRKNDPSSTTYSMFQSDYSQTIYTDATKTNNVYQFDFSNAIDSAQATCVAGDVIFIVITQVGSTTPGTGLYLEVNF